MRNVHWQQGLKSVYRGIARPMAASLKMDDDIHEIEEGANTSTNASPRPSCLGCRQALANSMMKSATESVSKLRRGMMPTIYIVPQRIRQVKEVAYEPQMVSIGPYHQGKERLQGMEEHKWMYLLSFLSRNPDHRLEDYLEEIEKLEDEARSCYSEKVGPLMGNEFVKIMVLDACFIVELFLKFKNLNEMLELLKEKEEQLAQKEKELEPEEELQVFFLKLNLANFFDDDRIFRTIGMRPLIGYDLLLLENQIPFIVLQRIVKKAYPNKEPRFLAESALDFFNKFMPPNKDIQIKKIEINDSCPYHHLLHLFHSHLIPTPTNSKEEHNLSCKSKIKPKLSCNPKIKPRLSCNPKIKLKPNLSCNPKIKSVLNKYLRNLLIVFLPCSNKAPLPITKRQWMIPCAADLELAGVKFKENEESNSILDLKFSDGVLEIPFLVINDNSETLFRNLVAFEQCYPVANVYFTTYLAFMDFLVNTSKDVALLHRNGIIDNLLGSDEDVAHLFNRLCIGIFDDSKNNYLKDVNNNVQKHCENKWNMWRASLKRDYFTNPWSFISLIAASILLLLTITQTFFTVFPYLRPQS